MNKCRAWIKGFLCAWMTVPLNGQGEKGIDTLKLLSRVKLGVYSLELSSGARRPFRLVVKDLLGGILLPMSLPML